MIHSIFAALAPIVFVVALGWFAGATGLMPNEARGPLAIFVVRFALPIGLFLAAAQAQPRRLLEPATLLALAVAFVGTYGLGYLMARFLFRRTPGERALQALTCSFPNMAYCGPPVLTAAVGT